MVLLPCFCLVFNELFTLHYQLREILDQCIFTFNLVSFSIRSLLDFLLCTLSITFIASISLSFASVYDRFYSTFYLADSVFHRANSVLYSFQWKF